MPVFEIERDGKTYEVEAPDAQTAAAAADPTKATAFVDARDQNAKIAAQHATHGTDWVREVPRQLGRGMTAAARGVLSLGGLATLAEQAVTTPMSLAKGEEVRGPVRMAMDALSPPELAPQNDADKTADALTEFGVGAMAGTGVGNVLSKVATAPARTLATAPSTAAATTRAVGRSLAETPGRQVLGAEGAAVASEDVRMQPEDYRNVPWPEVTVPLAVGAAAFAGAPRPPSVRPGNPTAPFGPEVEQARRLDFRVLPSQAKAQAQMNAPAGTFDQSVPGMIREAFVGPDFHTQALIDNQKRTNAWAAKELGVGEISEQGLALAKHPHNAVFNEVSRALPYLRRDTDLEAAANALGAARRDNPYLKNTNEVEAVRDRLLSAEVVPTQKALDAIREFRKDANTLYEKVGDTEAEQAATAYRGAADALEGALERQASVLNPGLIQRLKQARTALAKIHNVEDALDGRNVDAVRLAKIGEKFPLSGYLKEIADVARNFPDTMRTATGRDMEIQSQQGVINSIRLATQRALGHGQGSQLLKDPFQNRLGRADPNFDPRPAPPATPPSPIADFVPPDPNVPGGADVMPPGPTLPGDLGLVDPMANFDTLPPAEARLGDLTAETPPMGGTLPAQDLGIADDMAGSLDFGPLPQDLGLDFAPDPNLGPVSIVRGGAEGGTVADTLLSDELFARPDPNTGRPLDVETGTRLSQPGENGDDFTAIRPAPGLGDEFGTDFGAEPPNPLLEGPQPPLEGEWIRGGPQGPRPPRDPYANAEDAQYVDPLALPPPQKRLTGPDEPLGNTMGGMSPDDELLAAANGDEGAYRRIAGLLTDGNTDPKLAAPYLSRLFPEYVGGDFPPHGNAFGSAIWDVVNRGGYVGNIPTGELTTRLRSAKELIDLDRDPTR